jgi:hypothetical protein
VDVIVDSPLFHLSNAVQSAEKLLRATLLAKLPARITGQMGRLDNLGGPLVRQAMRSLHALAAR